MGLRIYDDIYFVLYANVIQIVFVLGLEVSLLYYWYIKSVFWISRVGLLFQ